jgi:hypothetical protein
MFLAGKQAGLWFAEMKRQAGFCFNEIRFEIKTVNKRENKRNTKK